MYERILADARLAPFFAAMPMDKQRRRMKEFLTIALGGPSERKPADMRAAHERPRAMGMGDEHFDAVAGHLAAELREVNIPEPLIAKVLTLLGSLRRDVLGR
jgi:truncated hemoglobin YjbI